MDKEYYIIPINRYINGLQAYQIIEAENEEDAERIVKSYDLALSDDLPSIEYICTGDFNKALAQLIVVDQYPMDLVYPIYLSKADPQFNRGEFTLDGIYDKIWK